MTRVLMTFTGVIEQSLFVGIAPQDCDLIEMHLNLQVTVGA